jgi:hypothetical protein
MNEPAADRSEIVGRIASILAGVYVGLRWPEDSSSVVDCAETKSESCDTGAK